MSFCDNLCCIDTVPCSSPGTIPVNFSGHHKVCEAHSGSFLEKFFECKFCNSIVLITSLVINQSSYLCEICQTESKLNRFGCEHLFCPICYTESYCIQCFYFCKFCNQYSKAQVLKCGHFGCSICKDQINCENCESSSIIQSNICQKCNQSSILLYCGHKGCKLCEVYFCFSCLTEFGCCKDCQEYPNFLAFNSCGHPTCYHNTNQFCIFCQVQNYKENCPNCETSEFLIRPYNCTDGRFPNQDSKICWNCLYTANKTYESDNYPVFEYAAPLETNHEKFRAQYENENLIYETEEIYKCEICKTTENVYTVEDSILCINCYNDKNEYPNKNENSFDETENNQQVLKCDECTTTENIYSVNDHFLCRSCYNNQNKYTCPNCNRNEEPTQLKCNHDGCKICINKEYCKKCNLEEKIKSENFNSPQICPNCTKTNLIIDLECQHQGCELCKHEKFCRNCMKLKNKCINCEKPSITNATFKCQHKSCYDCIYKNCQVCDPGQKQEECSRCKCKKLLCLGVNDSKKLNFCTHLSCYNCIIASKKCLKCESTTTNGIPQNQTHLDRQVNQEVEDHGYFKTISNEPICKNCNSKAAIYIFECHHYGCIICSEEKICRSCCKDRNLCINCYKNTLSIYSFECGHKPCEFCLTKSCKVCGVQEIKNCVRCNIKKKLLKQIKNDRICNHDACLDCFKKNKPCLSCESKKSSISIQEIEIPDEKPTNQEKNNKVNEIKINKFHCNPVQEDNKINKSDSASIKEDNKIKEKEEVKNMNNHPVKGNNDENCQYCNKIKKNCIKLNCEHIICERCLNLKEKKVNCPFGCIFMICGFCKTPKMCFPNKKMMGYYCIQCNNSKYNKSCCIECESSYNLSLLSCKHLYCSKCVKNSEKICSYCIKDNNPCNTCYQRRFRKFTNPECSHIQCANCQISDNNKCLSCTFCSKPKKSKEFIQGRPCIICKKTTKELFSLLCKHSVCDYCSKLNWRNTNYRCLICLKGVRPGEICIFCFEQLDFTVTEVEIIRNCCNRKFTKSLQSINEVYS